MPYYQNFLANSNAELYVSWSSYSQAETQPSFKPFVIMPNNLYNWLGSAPPHLAIEVPSLIKWQHHFSIHLQVLTMHF